MPPKASRIHHPGIIVIALVLTVMNKPLSAQQFSIDSLMRVAATAPNDSLRVDALNKLPMGFSSADTVLSLGRQMVVMGTDQHHPVITALGYMNLSYGYLRLDESAKSLDYALKALQIAEPLQNRPALAAIYDQLDITSKYTGALSSVDYGKLAIANVDSLHPAIFDPIVLSNYAYVITDRGEVDSALYYLNRAKKLALLLNRRESLDFIDLGFARVYLSKGQPEIARIYYDKILGDAAKYNTMRMYQAGYKGLGDYFDILHQGDSAVFYYKLAILYAGKLKTMRVVIQPLQKIFDYYKSIGKLDSALKYKELQDIAMDSLLNARKISALQNRFFEEEMRKKDLVDQQQQFQSRIKLYAALAALIVFLIVGFILYRNNRQKQKAYALLQLQKQEIDLQKATVEQTLEELKNTQSQLIQREKMASLGELTAGIAHEIQNPLNFVNNFSELNTELLTEMKDALDHHHYDEAQTIAESAINNQQKINHHGKRAENIVKGMLQHTRSGKGQKEPTDINALANEYLRLASLGWKDKDRTFSPLIQTDYDPGAGLINVVPQDIGRVLQNLYNNALFAVAEKDALKLEGYQPTVTVQTKKINNTIEISVQDNGMGIPGNISDRIFQPFFTTKPTGQGTGLGLSLSYDIVKTHGGELRLNSRADGQKGAEFVIQIPVG